MFIFAFVACVSSAAGRRPEDRPIFNAAVDRLLLGDALAQLPADHRAVVRRAYQRCTTAQIAADLHIAEGT
jgi:DNA-directed RNA polymerase specialized sigma24 family protein